MGEYSTRGLVNVDPWTNTAYVELMHPTMTADAHWLHVVTARPAMLDALPTSAAGWDAWLGIPDELSRADKLGLDRDQLVSAAAGLAKGRRDPVISVLAGISARRVRVDLDGAACAEAVLDLVRRYGVATAADRRLQAVRTSAVPTLVHRLTDDRWVVVTGDVHPVDLRGVIGDHREVATVLARRWLAVNTFTTITDGWRSSTRTGGMFHVSAQLADCQCADDLLRVLRGEGAGVVARVFDEHTHR